jgi:hypothetical protein
MLFVHNLVGCEINIAFAIVQLPGIFSGVSRFCNERSIKGETSQLVMVLLTGAKAEACRYGCGGKGLVAGVGYSTEGGPSAGRRKGGGRPNGAEKG